MGNVIALRSGPPEALRRPRRAAAGWRDLAAWLGRAIAGLAGGSDAPDELAGLGDRYLRDIGIERSPVTDRARRTVAWDAATGAWTGPDAARR